MNDELGRSCAGATALAGAEGTGGLAGMAPVGPAFVRAVARGMATRNRRAPGAGEIAARELGISCGDAVRLQCIAAMQQGRDRPEPATLAAAGTALAGWVGGRVSGQATSALA